MYLLTRAVAGLVTGALPINAHHSDLLHEASQVTFIILEKRLDLGVQFDGVVVCIATRHVSDGVPLRERNERTFTRFRCLSSAANRTWERRLVMKLRAY